jgi:hypothetical protein
MKEPGRALSVGLYRQIYGQFETRQHRGHRRIMSCAWGQSNPRPPCAKLNHMATETTQAGRPDPVVQFSIFTPNRLGRLHDLVGLLGTHNVHVLALMVLDTTESSIIRLVVDDPDRARELLAREAFFFTESKLLAVEVEPTSLPRLMTVFLEAELNIHYLYSFIPHTHGKSILALSMEDNELAEQALQRHQFRTLKQSDISR